MRSKASIFQMLSAACLSGIILIGSANAAGPAPKAEDVQKMEAALPDKAPATPKAARKVLVYGNAQGYVHSSIPLGEETIVKLGEKTGAWKGTISNDPAAFDDLSGYDAVMLVSTTGHFLIPRDPDKNLADDDKKAAMEKIKTAHEKEDQRMQNLVDFVEKEGKGVAGIHAATDAYSDRPQYGQLIGGYFNNHPWNEKVGVKVDDAASPLTQMFDAKAGLDVADEIYQFTPKGKDKSGHEIQPFSRESQHVLLSLDMTTEGRTKHNGNSPTNDYGVAWIKQEGKGRVFYCSLGHREEIYWNPTVLKFYVAGLQYALGDLPADATPSSPKTAEAK